MHVKVAVALLALAIVFVQAKPSHPFGFHAIPDHLDLVPPVLPPAQFHAADPLPLLPYHHQVKLLAPPPPPLLPHVHAAPLLPAPAPLLPVPEPLVPAPVTFLAAPAPLLPAPAPLLPVPAPAPLLPAPAPLLPAPVAAAPVFPPVLETVPLVEPIPSYRAIPGPKTTTHHLSVGYAFPQARLAKVHTHLHAVPHAHLHAAPWALPHPHHHHTLF